MQVVLTMLIFAVGAAVPLLAIGLLSRKAFRRSRWRLLLAGRSVRVAYGGLLAAIGLLIVSGYDQTIEMLLVEISPHWLTALTARF
jgi:cytochrome c-type biogenesis protein